MNNCIAFTNNIVVSEIIIWLTFFGFAIAIFPLHICNYVYVDKAERYASLNVTAYRYFKIANINTVKNSLNKMQINGKESSLGGKLMLKNANVIFNNLCLLKIVQLCDVGINDGNNANFALIQNKLSNIIYTYIELSGGKTKLKNYEILNYTHDNIHYYLKIVGVVNIIVILKIIFKSALEKL
jgi:hypothetical protein